MRKNRYNTTEISRWRKIDNAEPRSFLYWMHIEDCPLCTWINTTHWKSKPFSLYRFEKGLRPFVVRALGPPKTFSLDGYFCVVFIVVYNRHTHKQPSDITTIQLSKWKRCEHWLANGKRFRLEIMILIRFNRNSVWTEKSLFWWSFVLKYFLIVKKSNQIGNNLIHYR